MINLAAAFKIETCNLSFKLSKAMARFIGIFFLFVMSQHLLLKVTGDPECSTVGIRGLSGCECKFFGACDARGAPKAALNITQHIPSGLEVFGHSPSGKRNLVYLCEDSTVAILFDCINRIPIYAATVIKGSQLSGADSGGRPKGVPFHSSKTGLIQAFQQTGDDYLWSSKREICYKTRSKKFKKIDYNWYRAKTGSPKRPLTNYCVGGFDKLKVTIHKGHMIASQYGRGDQSKKKATFVYTNAVPQFGDFNSVPWQMCESRLIVWGQNNCARNGAARNVQMFIVVGVIPSTMFGPSEARYFGINGFSDYQDREYRVNVPKKMWTAACCTFEYSDDRGKTWRAGTKNTAFWRDNVPGKLPCATLDVSLLTLGVKFRVGPKINLFPSSDECNNSRNFISLP